jgi:hypothetical protein
MFVEIVRRPIGDAPDWVRDAWIGHYLPLLVAEKQVLRSTSVLRTGKGPFTWLWLTITGQTEKVEGYMVDARTAVDILAARDPRAADWWNDNTPDLLDGRQAFVFDSPCCELRAGAPF